MGIFFFISAASPALFNGEERSDSRPMTGSRFALVLIDADGLACPPCLVPLEQLCRAIPPSVQEEKLLGILTFRTDRYPDPRRGRIARTKWTGYGRANDLRFRVILDEAQSFNRLSEQGTSVLLFDLDSGIVKRRSAPFAPADLEEMIRFLVSPNPAIMERRP